MVTMILLIAFSNENNLMNSYVLNFRSQVIKVSPDNKKYFIGSANGVEIYYADTMLKLNHIDLSSAALDIFLLPNSEDFLVSTDDEIYYSSIVNGDYETKSIAILPDHYGCRFAWLEQNNLMILSVNFQPGLYSLNIAKNKTDSVILKELSKYDFFDKTNADDFLFSPKDSILYLSIDGRLCKIDTIRYGYIKFPEYFSSDNLCIDFTKRQAFVQQHKTDPYSGYTDTYTLKINLDTGIILNKKNP